MQNYRIDVRVKDDVNYQIEYWASSCVKYEFSCTEKELNIEELSIKQLRQIIKDKHFAVTKTIIYDSNVVSFENKAGTLAFQIEDGLAMVTKLATNEEVFFSMNGRTIDQLKQYNLTNFNSLKKNRKKITPLTTRIETSESNFGF